MARPVREIAIIIILIGGGLVILFSASSERSPLTEILYPIMRPAQEPIAAIHRRLKSVKDGYVELLRVHDENKSLKDQLRNLNRERASLISAQSENRRLKKLLNLKANHDLPSLVAQVIGEDASGWHRTLIINKGSDDGVQLDMAVAAADGILGRINRSSSDASQVLLMTDPGLAVDCRVVRTRDRGILTGSLERQCILRYIDPKSAIAAGDDLVTSGLDGIFPKGLPVGRVESVRKGPQGLFLEAWVAPYANFSEIEEVIVILGPKAGFDLQPGLEEKR